MASKPAKSQKQLQAEYRAAGRHYAAMFGKEPHPMDKEVPAILKPRRVAAVRTKPSESELLHSIMALLKHHPKVGQVWRQNSMTSQMEYGGKTRWVRANTARGMSDIQGILKGGRSFFIEVKAPGKKLMEHQAEFLTRCRENGALAFMADSVDTVLNELERIA